MTHTRTCTYCGSDSSRRWRRGLCTRCYDRKRRRGSLDAPPKRATLEYWLEVSRLPDATACWPWKAHVNEQGYGRAYTTSGRLVGAHRVAYERWRSPIPNGMTIDHLCHNADLTCTAGNNCQHRRCINPAHMEAVEGIENARRSFRPCHHDTSEIVLIDGGKHRRCQGCHREAQRRYTTQKHARS